MDESNIAPEFYVVNRELTDEQLALVQHALSITPIEYVVVASPQDVEFARQFTERVAIATCYRGALLFAKEHQPSLIVGKACVGVLEGCYADGEIQKIV
jgi:hypothetical protein